MRADQAFPDDPARHGAVLAWGLRDWAFSAFNAVATTFLAVGTVFYELASVF
ncbi:MAG TPA: hypothetical protein VK817_02575 [Trebonia sp.]|nr:hypothetical protein [Trebonia sp.]